MRRIEASQLTITVRLNSELRYDRSSFPCLPDSAPPFVYKPERRLSAQIFASDKFRASVLVRREKGAP